MLEWIHPCLTGRYPDELTYNTPYFWIAWLLTSSKVVNSKASRNHQVWENSSKDICWRYGDKRNRIKHQFCKEGRRNFYVSCFQCYVFPHFYQYSLSAAFSNIVSLAVTAIDWLCSVRSWLVSPDWEFSWEYQSYGLDWEVEETLEEKTMCHLAAKRTTWIGVWSSPEAELNLSFYIFPNLVPLTGCAWWKFQTST